MSFQKPIGDKSGFNEASFKMLRLHNLQILIAKSQMTGDAHTLYDATLAYYKELVGRMQVKEKDKCLDFIKKISEKFSVKNKGFKVRKIIIPGGDNLDSLLFDFDCYLRELADYHGYGTPEAADQDSL